MLIAGSRDGGGWKKHRVDRHTCQESPCVEVREGETEKPPPATSYQEIIKFGGLVHASLSGKRQQQFMALYKSSWSKVYPNDPCLLTLLGEPADLSRNDMYPGRPTTISPIGASTRDPVASSSSSVPALRSVPALHSSVQGLVSPSTSTPVPNLSTSANPSHASPQSPSTAAPALSSSIQDIVSPSTSTPVPHVPSTVDQVSTPSHPQTPPPEPLSSFRHLGPDSPASKLDDLVSSLQRNPLPNELKPIFSSIKGGLLKNLGQINPPHPLRVLIVENPEHRVQDTTVEGPFLSFGFLDTDDYERISEAIPQSIRKLKICDNGQVKCLIATWVSRRFIVIYFYPIN
jgi:hypothetical protein